VHERYEPSAFPYPEEADQVRAAGGHGGRQGVRWTKVDPPVAPAGDVGGDWQATLAYSARFRPAEEPADGQHALVTDSWYGEATGPTWRDGPFRLACQREYLICEDPKNPGSTEVWADSNYGWLAGVFASTAEAEVAARARASEDDGSDIRWDGRSTFVNPAHLPLPPGIELIDDDPLDLTPPDLGRAPDMDRGR
jgi:hypothetical protein